MSNKSFIKRCLATIIGLLVYKIFGPRQSKGVDSRQYVQSTPDTVLLEHSEICYKQGFYDEEELKSITKGLIMRSLSILYSDELNAGSLVLNDQAVDKFVEDEFVYTKSLGSVLNSDLDKHVFRVKVYKSYVLDEGENTSSYDSDFYFRINVRSMCKKGVSNPSKIKTRKVLHSKYLPIEQFFFIIPAK